MMRFVHDFGRLLLGLLLINLLLIWVLALTGTWSRWATNASNRRDAMRGGVIHQTGETSEPGVAILSEPLPVDSAENGNLKERLAADPSLTIAAQLIDLATAVNDLPQPVTLFLPTDDAFAQLPNQSVEALIANPAAAAALLNQHSTAAILPTALVSQMQSIRLGDGRVLPIDASDGLRVGNAGVVSAEIAYDGGLIHKVDRVLLPTADVSIDTPDGVTELDYTGSFLTINGSGRPDTLVIVHDGAMNFGNALVNGEGRWTLSGDLATGRHVFVAYLVQPGDMLPIGASIPIILNSQE